MTGNCKTKDKRKSTSDYTLVGKGVSPGGQVNNSETAIYVSQEWANK